MVGLHAVAFASVCALASCKQKRSAERDRLSGQPTTSDPATASGRPGDGDPEKVGLRVRVSVNGLPLPEGIACEVIAFDEGSSMSRRGSGECFERIMVERGTADIEVRLRAMGGLETKKRFAAERIEGPPRELQVDVTWPIGRLRVAHAPTPDITSCQVRIQGTQLSGEDTTMFTLLAGQYGAEIECGGKAGTVRAQLADLTVSAGRDTTSLFKLERGAAAEVTEIQKVSTERAAGDAKPSRESENPYPLIPGIPVFAPDPNAPPPPQSSRPEDLRVQTTKENP